jgi:hypothetical protein
LAKRTGGLAKGNAGIASAGGPPLSLVRGYSRWDRTARPTATHPHSRSPQSRSLTSCSAIAASASQLPHRCLVRAQRIGKTRQLPLDSLQRSRSRANMLKSKILLAGINSLDRCANVTTRSWHYTNGRQHCKRTMFCDFFHLLYRGTPAAYSSIRSGCGANARNSIVSFFAFDETGSLQFIESGGLCRAAIASPPKADVRS